MVGIDQAERVALAGQVVFHAAQHQRAAVACLAGPQCLGCQPQCAHDAGVELAIGVKLAELAAKGEAQVGDVLGGALGNVIDRVVHGQVIDFLLLYWRDWYWPAFNVADSCIVGGAAFLVLDELLRVRRTRA